MYDFIGVIQGGPEDRIHMTRQLFQYIDELFSRKKQLDMAIEEPIYLKNIEKGDTR